MTGDGTQQGKGTAAPEGREGDAGEPRAAGNGADAPTGHALISGLLRGLDASPGVYRMLDAEARVLYVGKARNLRARVANYARPSGHSGRIARMIAETASMMFLTTRTETEALLLEQNLIKQLKPRYNVLLRDDKTFPYLVITTREDFPRVFVTRNPSGMREDGTTWDYMKGARIFGPFTNAGALREAVQILQRVFKFRTCKLDIIENDPKNRYFRPCLLYSIGQCTAPCADKVSKDAYREDVDRFVRCLGSKRSAMLRDMRQEMQQAAVELRFEKAATLRDQVRALEKLEERASRSDGWQPESELSYIDPAKGLRSLQRTLGLDDPIRCIEAIDIAHLQGGETVGSKVCFVDGRPLKNEYRRYRIKTADNDDYASIREVVSRRYRDAGEGHELYPDVILIDGGLGQLHAALEALRDMTVKPPMVISLAKKEELIFVQQRAEPIRLGRENPGLRVCQAIRDEAHRFAQHYHHILRTKKTLNED